MHGSSGCNVPAISSSITRKEWQNEQSGVKDSSVDRAFGTGEERVGALKEEE